MDCDCDGCEGDECPCYGAMIDTESRYGILCEHHRGEAWLDDEWRRDEEADRKRQEKYGD